MDAGHAGDGLLGCNGKVQHECGDKINSIVHAEQ
jgi:hypothetical protein